MVNPNTKRQVVSLLFADLVGFSEVKDDDAVGKLVNHANNFSEKFLTDSNHCFFKTWGDAIFLATLDPADMLELSLQLRDWYRDNNWRRAGLNPDTAIRIGVHAEKANIVYDGSQVADIVGQHVSATARIEPVVPPNTVYCTKLFKDLVEGDSPDYARFADLGLKHLAKDFGKMQLFQICRPRESSENHSGGAKTIPAEDRGAFVMSIPKVRKLFTDVERSAYELDAFERTARYFQKAIDRLPSLDPDLNGEFSSLSSEKFTCRIHVKGMLKVECQVWYSKDRFSRGLRFSFEINDRNSSYNESLHVNTDGYRLFMKPMGAFYLGSSKTEALTNEEVGPYLWDGFAKQLEY